MSPVRHIQLPRLLVLLLILYFWALGVAGLDRFPKIYEDESWIAAPGYTFWERGYFGTDLFAGYYGMEQHYYDFPPLFSLLVGGGLHLWGMGLFQARVVPLMLVMLTLALVYRLGAKLFSPWYGALAVAILANWPLAQPTAHLVSGIPMADMARIVRYDAAVPLFGLAALLLLMQARRTHRLRDCLGCGCLTGLATLSHLYGALWFPALLLALIWLFKRRVLRLIFAASAGFGVALAPWLVFVASGWPDFLGQYRIYSSRFGLLDSRFYVANLSGESERYQPVFDAVSQHTVGATLGVMMLGLGLVWLLWQSAFKTNPPARILLTVTIALVGLFALLLDSKNFSYLATLWPLFALVMAAGVIGLWRLTTRRAWRLVVLALVLAAMADGLAAESRVQRLAQQTSTYQAYTGSIAALLPPDSSVLALQNYWLGLAEHTGSYRSILVPINWTNPLYIDHPVSFGEAAQAIPANVVLLDQVMLNFLAEVSDPRNSLHHVGVEIRAYLAERRARLIGEVWDPTYGLTEIYQLDASTG